MPELGDTTDPVVLIPGDPGALQAAVADLASYGDMLEEAGVGLRRIDTTDGWSGAAADQFRSVFHSQPAKWLDADDAFRAASSAVDSYLATLTWAQGQAGTAIEQWSAAQAASAKARADRDAGPMNLPFTDPGDAGRRAAREILNRARVQLTNAGNAAAEAIDAARDKAPPKPGCWTQLGTGIEQAAGEVGSAVAGMGKEAMNDLASFGNAARNHPLQAGTAAAGALLTAASGAGEVGGAALAATGLGAPAGAALAAISTGGVIAGAGITTAVGATMAREAAGQDRVQVFNTDSGGGETVPGEDPPFQPPRDITGYRDHAKEQMLGRNGGRGVNDEAAQDAFDNPIKPPQFRPDKYGGSYRYYGKDAVVNVNEKGEVTTAWARRTAGMRNPK